VSSPADRARVAIAGNPNAGKTSLFNRLTGAIQQVSNYPGVTVERKEGTARLDGRAFTVVDLPGTYSLTAYSQEEIVARNFVIDDKPEAVIDVVDASNLERNLYLTIQLLELGAPLVLALNMIDVARKRGFQIDIGRMAALLGVPVVATVAHRGEGVRELLEACAACVDRTGDGRPRPISYGPEIDAQIDDLAASVRRAGAHADPAAARWAAIKLIEGDPEVRARLGAAGGAVVAPILEAVDRSIQAIEKRFDDDAATVIAERRYGIAAGIVKECVTLTGQARQDMTDQIDTIVCNRAAGPLILVAVVAALFFCVFKVSDEWAWIPWPGGWLSPTGLMEWLFEALSGAVAGLRASAPMLHSLIDDAVIGGVGGVMSFVPLILTMFLFVAVLEDSGYIARVAFLLDRVLRAFGLQGKSILALIVAGGLGGGGCAVPGVMATRTLREEKDRLITMLVTPFMNCGAKMPVYAMLIAAFFPDHRTAMMLLLWAISWSVTLMAALALRKWILRGEQTPFVMELPPYHVPTLRGVALHAWERTWMYMKKAGTIILAVNILLWALMYFPAPDRAQHEARVAAGQSEASLETMRLSHSFAGRIGQALEPVSQYAGFDWRTNVALVGGFAAKEIVIGVLGTVYSMGEVSAEESQSLSGRLAADPQWSRLRALTLMIFVMLYAPCFVTMTVIRRESGSWKWALFSTAYSTTIAFALAVCVYQAGRALGWG